MNAMMPKVIEGVTAVTPREWMPAHIRKLRDTYAITPGVPLFKREFGYYCLEEWKKQGMPEDVPLAELFDFDQGAGHGLGQLGWCEAAFCPAFDVAVLEERGEHEVVRDQAGRHVLYFKNRRQGFMPEYLEHPVKDRTTWERDVRWRLDPTSPKRYANLEVRMQQARTAAAEGKIITQKLIGGYMYLRSLIGPESLLYMFYDDPDLIHACMQTWLALADAVIARHQEWVSLDEFFLAEDICYNNGPLISPDMMHEFLLPYYQQLIANVRARQLDKQRPLYIHVDTDGYADSVIPVYREIGMRVMSPFEVASGCDVVEIGRRHPDLVIFGGIDKRVLASNTDNIDRMLERILPFMRERGGYIPTCDHGVPAEVPYANYLHYRKRCAELGG